MRKLQVVCILVKLAQGGEGVVTDAPLKSRVSQTLQAMQNRLTSARQHTTTMHNNSD